jgi:hypothetical protein
MSMEKPIISSSNNKKRSRHVRFNANKRKKNEEKQESHKTFHSPYKSQVINIGFDPTQVNIFFSIFVLINN